MYCVRFKTKNNQPRTIHIILYKSIELIGVNRRSSIFERDAGSAKRSAKGSAELKDYRGLKF